MASLATGRPDGRQNALTVACLNGMIAMVWLTTTWRISCGNAARFSEAEAHYCRALEQMPDSAEIRNNRAGTLERLHRYEQAEIEYRRALELKPDFAEARFNLGMLLLSAGRYTEGWQYYEARSEVFGEHGQLPFPQWNGEDLSGKTLLLLPEQGYGDTIQFVRYVPLLKAQGAAKISVICKPATCAASAYGRRYRCTDNRPSSASSTRLLGFVNEPALAHGYDSRVDPGEDSLCGCIHQSLGEVASTLTRRRLAGWVGLERQRRARQRRATVVTPFFRSGAAVVRQWNSLYQPASRGCRNAGR